LGSVYCTIEVTDDCVEIQKKYTLQGRRGVEGKAEIEVSTKTAAETGKKLWNKQVDWNKQ
jgi:dihydroxyacetone kinase